LRWAKKIRAIELLGGACSKCGVKDYFCLEFHHVSEKEDMINSLRAHRWSMIEREIKKCVLLCKNCHEEHHCSNNGSRTYFKKIELLGDDIRCSRCKYVGDNLASLSFHHIGDKNFKISDIWNRIRKFSVEEICSELSNCEVLCSNCHALEQISVGKFSLYKDEIIRRSKEHAELPPPIDVSEVLKMKNQGMKQIEIANTLGCAKSTVSRIVKVNM